MATEEGQVGCARWHVSVAIFETAGSKKLSVLRTAYVSHRQYFEGKYMKAHLHLYAVCLISIGVLLVVGLPSTSFSDERDLVAVRPGDEIELGELHVGVSHAFAFTLESTSNKSVILVAIRPECQCTLVELPDERHLTKDLPLTIVIQWTPVNSEARQRKNILVQYVSEGILYSKVVSVYGRTVSRASHD